ncbi:MAG: CDP-alcohol phosphatidyltransferase family protein [Spirochaetes bacterium]|nr:CDP-alcohol phosphatidyltransferase family protein [Spirochaetota bacterium]
MRLIKNIGVYKITVNRFLFFKNRFSFDNHSYTGYFYLGQQKDSKVLNQGTVKTGMTEQEFITKANHYIEEPVNIYINRPLADFFVSLFYNNTPVTPNQVTFLAMIIGVISGFFFKEGFAGSLFIGAVIYQLSIVLDCVDGQLARLKKMTSDFGRILDGASDYVVGIAVFGGIYLGIMNNPELESYKSSALVILILLCISVTIHAISYDFIKTKFHSIAKTGFDATINNMIEQRKKYEKDKKNQSVFKIFLTKIYLLYTNYQLVTNPAGNYNKATKYTLAERKKIFEDNKHIFRLWSWIGPNSHFIILTLAGLFGNMLLFAWFVIIPMNIYYIAVVFYTKKKINS